MPAPYLRVSVGRPSGAADHLRYITRVAATRGEQDAVWTRHYPEYAAGGEDYADRRANIAAHAALLADREARRGASGERSRDYYNVVISYGEEVSVERARSHVDEWLARVAPDQPVVAAIHTNTRVGREDVAGDGPINTHVHVHIHARDVHGHKIVFDHGAYRTLDDRWAEIMAREYGRDRYDEHMARKGEQRAWRRDATAARSVGDEPPPRPLRAHRQAHDERDQRGEGRDGQPDESRIARTDGHAGVGESAIARADRRLDQLATQRDRTGAELRTATMRTEDAAGVADTAVRQAAETERTIGTLGTRTPDLAREHERDIERS